MITFVYSTEYEQILQVLVIKIREIEIAALRSQ